MEPISPEGLPRTTACDPLEIRVEAGKVYSWCSCGLTLKDPFCDSNHKMVIGTPYRSVKVVFDKEQEILFCRCRKTKTPPFCDNSHESIDTKNEDH